MADAKVAAGMRMVIPLPLTRTCASLRRSAIGDLPGAAYHLRAQMEGGASKGIENALQRYRAVSAAAVANPVEGWNYAPLAPTEFQPTEAQALLKLGRVDEAAVQGYNIAWLAIPTMGESWHCNHHAFPASARYGLYPGQADPGFRFVQLLEWLGLACDIQVPATLPPRSAITPLTDRALSIAAPGQEALSRQWSQTHPSIG